jgi:NAD(P)-dependent dehydrogenase (short-subunit alcohol dehydrogenase family)
MLCRNRKRGQAALAEFRAVSRDSGIELILGDLVSQQSVRAFVTEFTSKHDSLHGLLNCAGVQMLNRQITTDGLETMFATNYLGHFLLTNLLFDSLKAGAPSRVVTISGAGHKAGVEGGQAATVDIDDLQGEKAFSFAKASRQAVLAKILFTFELARRWSGTGIAANTVGPGLTRTNLVRDLPWYVRALQAVRYRLAHAQTPEQGASHIVYWAASPELEGVSGRYFEGSTEADASPAAYDEQVAQQLWHVSEKLVGQHFDYGE